MINETGEYFDYEDSYNDHVELIDLNNVPRNIRTFADKERFKISTKIAHAQGITCGCANDDYASLSDTQYLLKRKGKIIGYVISIDEDLSHHSQWDGSGYYLFIVEKEGKVIEVDRVGWSG